MTTTESAIPTVRIEPGLNKVSLGVAAQGECCSVSNMVEGLVRRDCTHNGIDSPVLGVTTSLPQGKRMAG